MKDSIKTRKSWRNIINYFFVIFNASMFLVSIYFAHSNLTHGTTEMFTPIRFGKENDHQHLIRVIQGLYLILWGLVNFTFSVVFFIQLLGDVTSVIYEKLALSNINDLLSKEVDVGDDEKSD